MRDRADARANLKLFVAPNGCVTKAHPSGFQLRSVPEGTYTLHVIFTSAAFQPIQRQVTVTGGRPLNLDIAVKLRP